MRIYTGGGDQGETSLFGGGRVAKDDPRVEAYGAIDEANAALGVARAAGLPGHLDALAARLQGELFVLGADLATPAGSSVRPEKAVRLDPGAAAGLEAEIDRCEQELAPLESFILPGGTPGGAALHLARTVCRRAERRLIQLTRAGEVSEATLPYVNRLSDLLFVMARLANARADQPEEPWHPQ